MKVSKLVKVLRVLRKPDAEVSFEAFRRRHNGKSQEVLSEQYNSKTHGAFLKGKPFHEDGFAREREVVGLEVVSDRFRKEDIGGTPDFPQPNGYYPSNHLWVKPEFAYRFVEKGLVKRKSLFARDREDAISKLHEMGIDPTYFQEVGPLFVQKRRKIRFSLASAAAGLTLLGYAANGLFNSPREPQKGIPKEIVSGSRTAVIPGLVSTNIPATNNVMHNIEEKHIPATNNVMHNIEEKHIPATNNVMHNIEEKPIPTGIISSPGKSVPIEARKPYVQPQNVPISKSNVNSRISAPVLVQTQQVYGTNVLMPVVNTNKLEKVVNVSSVPKVQKTNQVQKVEGKSIGTNHVATVPYSLVPFGKLGVQKEPFMVYSNALARANEFPFVFSREYDSNTILVPTLVRQDGEVKTELDLSRTGIKASSPNSTFSADGARLITLNGLWCELDRQKIGTNRFYVFPRKNGEFYVLNSDGTKLKTDSNRNVSLISLGGVYSTKSIFRKQYLDRRTRNN
jgi:hypothetical protein